MNATDAAERREALVELYRQVGGCTRCPLHETRTKAVFGAGDANADLMFVGEAPGAEEDRQGLPFVGRAGGLLNQLLQGIGLNREDVFICNVLKSRPPGNRDPQPDEIDACWPYLERQIQLIEPRVIATLGNFATKKITGSPIGITRVRGTPQVHELAGRSAVRLPALASGGGAADAVAGRDLQARTSPAWRRCSPSHSRVMPPRRLRPRRHGRIRRASSTCSDEPARDPVGRRDGGDRG